MKNLIKIFLVMLTLLFTTACTNPKEGTVEDKGAVKGDSLNVREGSGEGPVGDGDLGSG